MSSTIKSEQELGVYRKMLDPRFVSFFDKHMRGLPQSHQVPFEYFRSHPQEFVVRKIDHPGPNIGREYTIDCPVTSPPGVLQIHIYEPRNRQSLPSDPPLYIHYHGGGWVAGAARMDAPWLRRLVSELDIMVADVNYRLAPEFPYPTPVNDAWESFEHLHQLATSLGFDPTCVMIGGTSAGGNLATVTALRAAQAGYPLFYQVLVVPVVDGTVLGTDGCVSEDTPYESWKVHAGNPVLSSKRMAWFYDLYLGAPAGSNRQSVSQHWTVSPINSNALALLPPTLVAVAEVDILKDEGRAYAKALRVAGVHVTFTECRGMPHTFLHFGEYLSEADRLQCLIINTLRGLLQRHTGKGL